MSIIYDVKKNVDRNIYTIFGIKFSINKKRNIFEYLKIPFISVEFFIKTKLFRLRNKLYLEKTNKQIKKRLILTTGSISLINSIVALKQKGNFNEYEDYLYVWSVNKNPEFKECCKKIASLYPFEKIYYFEDFLKEQLNDFSIKFFVNNLIRHFYNLKIYNIDEIFSVKTVIIMNLLKNIFCKNDIYLIDESAIGKMAITNIVYDNIVGFIMPTYLGKIDFRGFLKKEQEKFVELDAENFLEVADACAQFYPLDINCNLDDKVIIFCGTWGSEQNYSAENLIQLQKEYIEKLQKKGYVVYFKPHPRDIFPHEETETLKILKTRLPLECYDIENVVAIVSLFSYSSLQSYHYRKIPGFVCIDKLDLKIGKSLALVKEYTPDLDIIIDIDPRKYSLDELKSIIRERYLEFLNSKPMLSQNPVFDVFYKQ